MALGTAYGYLRLKGRAALTSPIPSLSASGGLRIWGTGGLIVEVSMAGRGRLRLLGRIANATQSAKISAISQQLSTEPLITLFQLDLSKYRLGIGYFTPMLYENMTPLLFGGHKYYPMPVEATGFERRGEGAEARPRVKISAITPTIAALIQEGGDLAGCELRRLRTFRRFLDDGEDPNTTDQFIQEIWRVERLGHLDNEFAEFELASFMDVEQKQLPGRRIIRDYCDYVYRRWNPEAGDFIYDDLDPCPYVGAESYDKSNQEVTSEKDICGKHLANCKQRFGKTAILPFRGFPGVSRVR